MLPTGIVTFLFTDLEGSTRLWEQHPEAMKSALARHDAILSEIVSSGGGQIVKTTGDGLHAVFASANDALKAVIVCQRALLEEPWELPEPLRVRMGLHSGEADFRQGDYYGSVVNRAARIMGAAAGEQILVSGSTTGLIAGHLPENTTLLDLGHHHLRGLKQPERLFQLCHPALPAEFPPLKSLGHTPNNLPVQVTSFVGREVDLSAVISLLVTGQRSEVGSQTTPPARLVTLTGTGGTGKTRLSLETAAGLLDYFEDGIWFVELAPIADPLQVLGAIAAPLGLREQPTRPLEQIIVDHLRSMKMLLILDNCEHLIDECARLAGYFLGACPRLQILASSREAFGISGENTYRVRSLMLPPVSQGEIDVEALANYEAIRLFVERVRSFNPAFFLTGDNAADVLKICRRLDGIPLALELAAARTRVLSPAQIALRLDDRFRLLTGGSRTALPRQRTLQALIDWSYDLLTSEEQLLIGRLSVFAGGWTLEAAEEVAGFDPLDTYQVLDLLELLVNKSLVVAETDLDNVRYHMLESIRQYSQEKLAESGRGELLRDRHMAYFLAQSQQAHQQNMDLQPPGDWPEKLAPELDNLRSAWTWAENKDIQAALSFAVSFNSPWSQIVPLPEVFRFQKRALELADQDQVYSGPDATTASRRLLGRALLSASRIALSGRYMQAGTELATRAVVVSEEVDDLATLIRARMLMITTKGFAAGPDAMQDWFGEFDLVLKHGTPYDRAQALVTWHTFHLILNKEVSETGNRYWREGLTMFQKGGDLWSKGMALRIAADFNNFLGHKDEARALAMQVIEIYDELGDPYAAIPARSLLADLARQEEDLVQAARLYRETIQLWRDTGRADASARTMESLAFITAETATQMEGENRRAGLVYAIKLLGAAAAAREAHNFPLNFLDKPEFDRQLVTVKDATGESLFSEAWSAGQALDLDQAVLLAIDASPENDV